MIFLLIFVILAVPYFTGSALMLIFGERIHRGPIRWILGAAALLFAFLVCLLAALRLDLSLYGFCRLYGIFCAACMVGSLPVYLYGLKNKMFRFQNFDKKIFIWLGPAVLLGAFSLSLSPVYVNDVTVEIVRTTLKTGRIYEYSALLGTYMEAGLPIFSKIEIMPMLYAVLSRDFGVDVYVLIAYISPALAYTANIFLMWEISRHLVSAKNRWLFMLFHLVFLIAGTYLPETAIPVTVGEPLLVQGYSGYAWAYGVVVPLTILMLLDRRFIAAGIGLAPILGLLRYDRIFYCCKEFFTSYHLTNTAGKLWALYLLALVWWVVRRKRGGKISPHALLSGSALVCATLTDAYERIGEKKTFIFSSMLIMLACVYFVPFEGTEFAFENDGINVSEIVKTEDDVTIWAPTEIMSVARRQSADIYPVYGRDYYEELLDGVNYETVTDDMKELYYAMSLLQSYYMTDDTIEPVVYKAASRNTLLDEVDIVVLPLKTYSDKVNIALVKRGFVYCEEYGDYLVMRRYD